MNTPRKSLEEPSGDATQSPPIMGSVSSNKLNQIDVPSPYKKRKLNFEDKEPNNDMRPKSSAREFRSYIPGSHSKIEELNSLRRSGDKKEWQVNDINTNIMTLKTQKYNVEFENYRLDDEFLKLNDELKIIVDQIDELKHHEHQSLQELDTNFEISTKELKLKHDIKLQHEKEVVTKEVETLIGDIQSKHIREKELLEVNCNELNTLIKNQAQDLNDSLDKLKQEHNKKLADLENNIDQTLNNLENELKIMESDKVSKTQKYDELNNTILVPLKNENSNLTETFNDLQTRYKNKQQEINELRTTVLEIELKTSNSHEELTTTKNDIVMKEQKIIEMKEVLINLEQQRRSLHNRLQELKGNIRVYCRVRPPSDLECLTFIDYPEEMTFNASQQLTIHKESENNTAYGESSYSLQNKNAYTFNFDKVFSPNDKNEQVFDELSQLIQSSLDGYNVCVFAYGQTGSGKTWTMAHSDDGMIPLSINKIFNDIESLKAHGWEYKVEGQFLEIYNETIIDLLSSKPSPDVKYEIKHDDINNRTSVSNLKSIILKSASEAITLFDKASRNRSTASTKSNERSSRSHSIFILSIKGHNNKNGSNIEGCLNLVDLAGSERLNSSQAKGDRLKETQHINKSLSSLGDVIYSLSQVSKSGKNSYQHIPYRNSKLTYLLKNSLGGDAKTLMFVNISPLLANFSESLNSLRFASKVGNTKQGLQTRK